MIKLIVALGPGGNVMYQVSQDDKIVVSFEMTVPAADGVADQIKALVRFATGDVPPPRPN